MADAIVKKSKLELEKEQSKKRTYSEAGLSSPCVVQEAKRQKMNSTSEEKGGFMNDVVIKKSKLQMEKEAAIKAQIAEKENQLRNTNQKGLVMKFEVPIDKQRSSKSPRG